MMDYDVIIVGARIAGSVLAVLLAEQGQRVLLLDKAHFPSDTLSTHFFRDHTLRVFDQIGVLDEVKTTAPALTTLWNNIDGQVISDPIYTTDGQFPYYMCVRRITLDWILAQRVIRQPGIEFRQEANVKELIWQDGQLVGVGWNEVDGMGEARARVVVGADGFYSTLAKKLEPAYDSYFTVRRLMYYTYFQGIEPLDDGTNAEHHFLGDSLAYVFATDSNLTQVAVSLPVGDFQWFRKDPLGNLLSHLAKLPLLAPRLRKAEVAAEAKGAANIPCYQRMPYGSGWVLVGDAHQVMDPWSGMGIDHATTHATMLANALQPYLIERLSWGEAMSEYHSRVRQWSEKTYRRTSTYAADLRPMTAAALQKRGLR